MILKEYPEVNKSYSEWVLQERKSKRFEVKKKFWNEFISLQKLHNTVLLGGDTEVVVPFKPKESQGKKLRARLQVGNVEFLKKDGRDMLGELIDQREGQNESKYEKIRKHNNHGSRLLTMGKRVQDQFSKKPELEFDGDLKDLEARKKLLTEELKRNTVQMIPNVVFRNSSESRFESSLPNDTCGVLDELSKRLQSLAENRDDNFSKKQDIFEVSSGFFKESRGEKTIRKGGVETIDREKLYEEYHNEAKELLSLFYLARDKIYPEKLQILKTEIYELIGSIELAIRRDPNVTFVQQLKKITEEMLRPAVLGKT